jgi:hypothetical protein
MEIKTEQDMRELCSKVRSPFDITCVCRLSSSDIETFEKVRQQMIEQKHIRPDSEPIQGIKEIDYFPEHNSVKIEETPYLFPSPGVIEHHPELTGPMTGVLVNAYDPKNKTFLFHMRGRSVDQPFGFQAAAAGFGVFGEHLYKTAVERELPEEAGIYNAVPVSGMNALGIMPFMKGPFPQPLFNFGFFYDSASFPAILYPVLSSLEQITEFEDQVKSRLREGTLRQREGYHFNVPHEAVEKVVRDIYDRDPTQQGRNGGFFGPIVESYENFARFLKDLHNN